MSRRVLVVDDSPVVRELLGHATKLVGDVEVDHADDGVSAMQALRTASGPYDLVFVDLNMPVMDGMKLLSYMRADPTANDTVIAVVTTEESQEAENQARALGAHYFLRKPVASADILEVLRGSILAEKLASSG